MALANLIIKIGADISEIQTGMDKTVRIVEKGSSQIDSFASSIKTALIGAFTISAIESFGAELLRMGDDIVRTADRTGLLTDEVQKLSYIAGQSGNSIDEITASIGQMQNRLASGDKSAVGAIKALNLNFDELRNSSPYDQFTKIAEAVGKIPDPAQRAQVAMDLFGRAGIAILPTLTANVIELGKQAPVMSDKTVRALDTAGDALDRFGLAVKVSAAESYNFAGKIFDKLVAAIYNYVASIQESIAGLYSALAKIPGSAKVFPTLAADIKGLGDSALWYRDAAKAMVSETDNVSGAVHRAIPAIAAATPQVKAHGDAHKAAADNVKELGIALDNNMIPKVQALAFNLTVTTPKVEAFGIAVTNSMIPEAPAKFREEIQMLPPAVDRATASVKDSANNLDVMARALSDVGRAAGGAFGAVLNGAASAIGSFGELSKATEKWQKEIAAGTKQSALDSIGYWGKVASFTISTFKALQAVSNAVYDNLHKTTAEQNRFTLDHIEGLRIAAIDAGVALDSAFDHKTNAKEFNSILARTQSIIQKNTDLLNEYNLTWKDLGTSARQSHVDEVARQLVTDMGKLRTVGLDAAGAIRAQSGALNQLVIDSIQTGTRIPGAMQPILEQLIRMGGLTDAAARAMLGLAADTMPSLADITEAAGRYGLSLDALGPKVQQLRISETAAQIVKDFDLLIGAGADVGVVMVGMQEKVQGLVTSALTLGLALPESMRPLIEKMIEAGLLTDQFGGKLQDASSIQFAKPITDAIEDLVRALNALVDKMNTAGSAADDMWRRVRGDAPVDGTAVPRPTTPTAPTAGPRIIAFPSSANIGISAAHQSSLGAEMTGGDINIRLDAGELWDRRAVKITRRDAARGGLTPRTASGRSY
jgi:hypothetical protein